MFSDALKTKNRRDEKAGFLSSIPIKKKERGKTTKEREAKKNEANKLKIKERKWQMFKFEKPSQDLEYKNKNENL